MSKIKQYVFQNCTALNTADFPMAKVIDVGAFKGCTYLTSVSMPLVEFIGDYAFYECNTLTSAVFPSCTGIGPFAFAFCYRLSTDVYFPNLTQMFPHAFAHCVRLESIDFPSLVSFRIGEGGGGFCFESCAALVTAYLSSVHEVPRATFQGCTVLSDVRIPLAENIGSYAFNLCSSISVLSFPLVSYIYEYAFQGCRMLISLYLLSSSVCTLKNSNAFNLTPIGGSSSYAGQYGSIYVPASLYNDYISATNWSLFASRIVSV